MNEVQRFIRELMSNERFRQLALSEPSAALSRYQLTAAEAKSLARLVKLSSDGTLVAARRWAGTEAYWM